MRKLVFMLRVNARGGAMSVNQTKNIEISTHKGARLLIKGNQATVLDVTDDDMSDAELQTWYRSRYSGFGMGISIIHDPETTVSSTTVESKEPSPEVVVPTVKQAKTAGEHTTISEGASIVKVEPKLNTGTKVDEMTYFEMIQFAKDHGVHVKGRAKELYVEALVKWFKEHDGQ